MNNEPGFLERPRIQRLFQEAARYPLVLICAGAGYGKTRALADFARGSAATIVWVQLAERDNIGSRFWENYVNTVSRVNQPYAKAISVLEFPDTDDKINKYHTVRQAHLEVKPRLVVIDDAHFIEDPAVMYFLERMNAGLPPGTSLFFVTRSLLNFNVAPLAAKGLVFNINENELRFTENELTEYFRQQGIAPPPDELRIIHKDTGGWAFAVNLIVRSYQKAPAYQGYLRNAMKTSIFRLMEAENYNRCTERLQNFYIRLSLIEHLSLDLLRLLAKGDNGLIAEFERQSAYVRFDSYSNAYLIHHLFLEFLRGKQALLTEEEKRTTYKMAADWCNRNGFKIDAFAYYEKVGDYASIVGIFLELPTLVPYDIARYTAALFDRAPQEAFDRVSLLAAMHVRAVMRLGLLSEALALIEHYENRYLGLPEDDTFRNHTLGGIYFFWGILRTLLCATDDRYDFDVYYQKMDECLTRAPFDPGASARHPMGPWVCLTGSTRKGAPQDYIDALARAEVHLSHGLNGTMAGVSDLARGELLFYQANINDAEPFIVQGLERAQAHGQFELVQTALLYILRIALYQGNFPRAEQALNDMEELLGKSGYEVANRFIIFDIALACYYAYLKLPERLPDWLKSRFAPFGHTYFIENFGNRAKTLYYYLRRNYPPLLAYMQEQRQREAVLFGRVEMLALEACVHLQTKNRPKALAVLKEAYETAAPNDILMPFIRRGKDMRTLCSTALKEPGLGVPPGWLAMIMRKASSHAKRRSYSIAEYKRVNHIEEDILLTPRELDILTDISHGLSRPEIAASHGISVNTVKMALHVVGEKLGAENLADLIRISAKRNLI